MSTVEFAIIGAGAIGTILGAHLAQAGRSVVMLARGRRGQQIERDGLRIRGLAQIVTPVRVILDPTALPAAEVLIVATKALDTAMSLEPLRRARIDHAFSIQNGVVKDDLLAAAFGGDRVLGALANTSGELLGDGDVLFTRNVNLLVGEIAGGISARAERIAQAIDTSGVRAAAVPDIRSQEWSKFVAWVGVVSVAVTTRVNTWKSLSDPGAARVLVRLVREMASLARACGVRITDDSFLPIATLCRGSEEEAVGIVTKIGSDYRANAPEHRLSTLQDLDAGRALEIEETLGFAVRKARELELSMPLVHGIYHLTAAIDRVRNYQ
jgi:2-dehydropantoate 2-reductase